MNARLGEELHKYLIDSAYLYVCFGALLLYKASLMSESGVHTLPLGFAAGKALILGKFVLIGEAARIGASGRSRSLLHLVARRTVLFLVLLGALTIAEEILVARADGPSMAQTRAEFGLKERLMSEDVVLVCMNCRTQRRSSVGNLPEQVKCAKCGGVLLAAIQPYVKSQLDILKKGASTEEQRKELKRIYKNANLVMAHGRRAVLALVGRGVGPDTAARILARYQTEEDEFLRDVLSAEIMYARTKRFWD